MGALPVLLGLALAFAVLMYVATDGFDLGMGILLPFAPSDDDRNQMIDSIAPFWDGNETWLVLGATLMIAAFPLACATLLPAFYVPLFAMLFALVFRGVAFEFRFRATRFRRCGTQPSPAARRSRASARDSSSAPSSRGRRSPTGPSRAARWTSSAGSPSSAGWAWSPPIPCSAGPG